MILFFVLAFVSSSLAEDSLRQILKSPKSTLELYRKFKVGQGLTYRGGEDQLRFRLFRDNAEFVAELSEHKDTATYGLNFFSSMTSDEKKQYLGLNVTGHLVEDAPVVRKVAVAVPRSKLWTNEGAVTEVKNQGSCGSCWTFGAVGGLETRYQQGSGKLRNFAEQEYLDCVYEGKRDGCEGGWPDDAYSYSERNGGRLASTVHYQYTQRDGRCIGSSTPDAMVAMKIVGFVKVGTNEAANIEALVTGSLSVAFEVTNTFQQYRGGIMKDTTCRGQPNHAVTAVGYTQRFVLVKNSWGSVWGDSGFVKFARSYGNCGLFQYSSYPKLTSTGESDTTPSDPASSYRHDTDEDDDKPDPKPACKDAMGKSRCRSYSQFCQYYQDWAKEYCAKTCNMCEDVEPEPEPQCKDTYEYCNYYTSYCKYTYWAKANCAKTCQLCGGDDEKCPSGTIRCSDGVCRHEHMCQ